MPRQAQPQRTGRQVTTREAEGPEVSELLCTCCTPPNPLVLRPDLGQEPDGRPTYALCVFHVPEPTVYKINRAGGYTAQTGLRLNDLGELVDGQGQLVAQVRQDGFQRLTTVDDEDDPDGGGGGDLPDSGPLLGGGTASHAGTHVDLSQDEFYRSRSQVQ